VKIVVISPRLPYPLEKGDKLRLYHQLKVLAKKHEIVLISLSDVDVNTMDIEHLKSFVSDIHVFKLSRLKIALRLMFGVFSDLPFQVLYFFNRKIKKEIHSIIKSVKPDFIYNQLLRTAEYTKDIESFKIIDYMDSFSQGMKKRLGNSSFPFSFIYNLEYKRLKAYETKVFSYFDKHLIISEQDRNSFAPSIKDRINVMPNGVDIDFFSPGEYAKVYDIGFVGNMGYRPNIIASEFLIKEVYPLLKNYYNNIRIVLAGARPHNRVKSLESGDVIVTGWVEDIRKPYGETKIFVAPIFTGIGQQNKILEAMSMQIPVITTSGVNNAIGAKSGSELLIADNAKSFADHIIFLLENNQFAHDLGIKGRDFVKKNYSWDYQGKKVLELFSKKI